VRVYKFDGTDWAQVGSDIDGEESLDGSGYSLDMSSDGNTLAIGAPKNDGNGISSGHVRVYKFDGTDWAQVGSDIDGEESLDGSGWSVSMSSDGNTLAIGAPENDGNGILSGNVRVYKFDGTYWTQVGSDIDGKESYVFSGRSVAMSSDGNTLAIGAPFNDGNGIRSGHVRVYKFDGTDWTQVGSDIDGEESDDSSGYSVAMSSDGNTLAIGAPKNDGISYDSGSVRVYKLQSSLK